jgi:hypothetical protein
LSEDLLALIGFWGPVPSADAQGVTATVTGRLSYVDRQYGMSGFTGLRFQKPIRFMDVQVIRESDGTVLGSGASNANGNYSVSFNNPGPRGVYVRALSRTHEASPVRLVVENNIVQNALYAVVSSSFDETVVQPSVDLVATVEGGSGGVFNILDVLTDASEFVRVVNQGTAPPPASIYWEAGGGDGTCYSSTVDAIFVLGGEAGGGGDTDEYDDDILLHEYGHFLARHLSRDDSPGGTHRITDHTQDVRLAWSEGWAHFLSGAVRKNSYQIDTVGGDPPDNGASAFEIESPSFGVEGIYSTSELSVATVLWDIFDDPGDPMTVRTLPETFDNLMLGMTPIWDVVTQAQRNVSLATLGTFWEGWFARGHNFQTEMEAIFSNREVEFSQDNFEGDNATGSSREITVNASSPERHTLYPVGDVDMVAFDGVAGQLYTVLTSNLTNGTDTFLEILDSDGVTLLASNDNRSGQQYDSQCGLDPVTKASTCPSNDSLTLSSRINFSAPRSGIFYARITRSPSAPPSAGCFGSFDVTVTSP